VPHEQRPAQLLFEQVDPGAYGGLADIEPFGRADEIAAADDFKECSDDLGVHESYLAKILLQTPEIFRLSGATGLVNVARSKMMHRGMLKPVGEPTIARRDRQGTLVMTSDPRSKSPLSSGALAPAPAEPDHALSRQTARSHMKRILTGARTMPKSHLQTRWERRWTAASGAWFALVLALLLGAIDWRLVMMVAATAFMLARSGDMLDNYDA
jgi:hypothetical protein